MANPNKEQYFFSDQKYICFLTSCQNAIRLTGLPEYSSRYSRRDFNQHQLLTLLLFNEYLGFRYRDFVKLVEIMSIVQEQLNLDEIPHYSTLCKFSKRIPTSAINQLFRKACSFMAEWKTPSSVVAIDSSGFTPNSSSTYYSARLERPDAIILKRPFPLIRPINHCCRLPSQIAVVTTHKLLRQFSVHQIE